MRSRPTSFAALALALVLASCGGDDGTGQVHQLDTAGAPDVGDTTGPDATGDTVGGDTLDAVGDVGEIPLGGPCTADAACLDGTCFGAPTGVCAPACGLADACGAGRTCAELGGVKLCVSADDVAGLPCVSNDTCPADAVCRALADGTSRCVFLCSDFNCDVGFSCDSELGVCLPAGGFACSLFDVAAGVVGRCVVANAHGSCAGELSCPGAGAAMCSAQTPAAEACDGEDNDCDSQLDEDTCDDGDPCTVDSCDGAAGSCVNAVAVGAACDDGDPCTSDDVCAADGACAGSGACPCDTVADCPVPPGDLACLSVTCAGSPSFCGFDPINEGGGCDDGDLCTEGDRCAGGACAGAPKDCSGLDTACGPASCEAGSCVAPAVGCAFTFIAQLVTAAVQYTPAGGAHMLQCSIGHSGPTGVSAAATGHKVHFGFHATRR